MVLPRRNSPISRTEPRVRRHDCLYLFAPDVQRRQIRSLFSWRCRGDDQCIRILGVQPLLGRTFSEEDGRPGAPPVFVMNYQLWQRQFGGDPKILGNIFILNGKPTTLVGIMPQQFNPFAWWINVLGENFWRPITRDPLASGSFQLMGRLKP